uniref:Uncharacterized protein n=1 Tax=Tanacetum cinerariifolium TaxID=118510 RepID=A0A6L2KV25_TANCI|nr:hypothetical protein [Tanacetum cinerariifolium]
MYGFKECSSCGALYNKSCSCSKGGFVDKFVRDKTPDSSQRPRHNCPKCGNPVDGLYCRQCALLRKKLKEDPGANSSQSPPHIDHHCCYGCGDPLDAIFCQRCTCLLLAWDRVYEIKDDFRNKQYKLEDIQELIRKLFNDVHNIHEELAEYINTLSWNRHAFYNYDDDDNEDYTIAITPILSTEEPVDSLIMEDEHLDTIPATKLDEVIKSSVEDLVPFLNESEGIPDNMCDVPFHDNSLPLDISKEQFEDFSDFNDDSTSIDDDSFSIDDIYCVEASPPHSELISLEEMKDFHPEDGELEDDVLREKLSKINLLIAKIEALNANPTPSSDFALKPPSLFPNSFLEETDTFDNSLPESKIFCFDIEEKNSGSTTIHADISLSDLIISILRLSLIRDCPDFKDSFSWFCLSITRSSHPQLHLGNPIS